MSKTFVIAPPNGANPKWRVWDADQIKAVSDHASEQAAKAAVSRLKKAA